METDVKSREFKELLVRLYQNVNNIALALNIKDTGMYDTTEFVNGQLFYPNPLTPVPTTTSDNYRQVYRKTINFGALPNAGIKTVAHGITCDDKTTFTRIYATASDTTNHIYLPIPYVDPVRPIGLYLDNTLVYIEDSFNYSSFDTCYVILEYMYF
jgi:hypothetical protein